MKADPLRDVEPRTLLLVLAAAVGLTAIAAYLYLFKTDLKDLRRLREVRIESTSEVAAEQRVVDGGRIAALEAEVAALRSRLYGKSARLPAGQMVSYIIGQLDAIAVRHDVHLESVKPGPGGEILNFEEVPFDVEVSGRYFDLFAWLQEAERELRPMVVKQFHLAPGAGEGGVRMDLRVVSYRPPA